MNSLHLSNFIDNIQFTDEHWLWIGHQDKDGYGRVTQDGKDRRAARVAASWWLGLPIDCLELQPDHLCEFKNCVRPECLQVVTIRHNARRARGWTLGEDGVWYCKRNHRLTPDNIKYTERANNVVQTSCRLCSNLSNRRSR